MSDLAWRLAATAISVVAAVAFGAVMFVAAGTIHWRGGWIWLVLLVVASVVFTATMDAALIKERMTGVSPLGRALSAADVWGGVIVLLFFMWLPMMGLDAVRYRWTTLPSWTKAVGAVLFVASNVLIFLTLRTNVFASSAVRVQEERGQTVVTDGPYAVVRHPMYSGVLLYCPGTALILGSLIGLMLCTPIFLALAIRTLLEDRMLHDDLAGYREYAQRVRYRSVPGLW